MILILQIFWAIGCIIWNLYGLYLIERGQSPIGPTATALGAGICAVFAILFWILNFKKIKWPYIIISGVAGFMASITIYGAFTKEENLWPSDGWRWTGILLNSVGTFAAIAAIATALKWNAKK